MIKISRPRKQRRPVAAVNALSRQPDELQENRIGGILFCEEMKIHQVLQVKLKRQKRKGCLTTLLQ